jgi:hypothetical protein
MSESPATDQVGILSCVVKTLLDDLRTAPATATGGATPPSSVPVVGMMVLPRLEVSVHRVV